MIFRKRTVCEKCGLLTEGETVTVKFNTDIYKGKYKFKLCPCCCEDALNTVVGILQECSDNAEEMIKHLEASKKKYLEGFDE